MGHAVMAATVAGHGVLTKGAPANCARRRPVRLWAAGIQFNETVLYDRRLD
jgi:hypothetical protein